MDRIVKFTSIAELTSEELKKCRSLVEKDFWPALEGKDPWGVNTAIIHGIAAWSEDKLVGIILATLRPSIRHAKVITFFVIPELKHEQVATQLMTQLEKNLLAAECSFASYIYQTDLPTTNDLENLLQKLGWSAGSPFSVRCHFKALEFHPKWLHRSFKLPRGYKIFPWKKLTQENRAQLLHELDQEIIPSSVSPFHNEDEIEPINSLGLKKNGKIIGWMIIHRKAPDTLKYSALYINRDQHFLGYAIALLTASILLQQKAKIENSYFDLNLEEVDSSWISFVKKRLMPGTSKIDRFKESSRNLGPQFDNSETDQFMFEL